MKYKFLVFNVYYFFTISKITVSSSIFNSLTRLLLIVLLAEKTYFSLGYNIEDAIISLHDFMGSTGKNLG